MNFKVQKTEDFELGELPNNAWDIPSWLELKDVTSGNTVEKKAKAKLLWSEHFLYVLFDVDDDHIWGTYQNDDDPIYNEEVVEVFIANGDQIPQNYLEIQFSPNGVKFDAKVKNPTGSRHDSGFDFDVSWNSNLTFRQKINVQEDHGQYKSGRWCTQIKIPSVEFGASELKMGDRLKGNLFRIDGFPKQNSFQALVPNMEPIPNFHTPKIFATFELIDEKME